jgi:hypothetical protein
MMPFDYPGRGAGVVISFAAERLKPSLAAHLSVVE